MGSSESPSSLDTCLAQWVRTQPRNLLRAMVDLVSRPGIVSLAGGLPDPELFPAHEVRAAYDDVLSQNSAKALQYGPPLGRLKEQITEIMRLRGSECRPEQVVITTGAQQGITICSRLFLEPGQAVGLEGRIYTGAQQAVAPYVPRILPLESDLSDGLDPASLQDHLVRGEQPGLVYVIPEGHNPLGVTLASERRHMLIALSREHGFPLVEDDPYGLLAFDGRAQPPLRALGKDRVVYLGSFSKILTPALRLGWMVLPESLVNRVAIVKEAIDLESSALTQRVVSRLLETGMLSGHVDRLRASYRQRRDAMVESLDQHFAGRARFSRPEAGMFVWMDVDGLDAAGRLESCVESSGIAYVPGAAFACGGHTADSSLRLSFSNVPADTIRSAIPTLAKALLS